MVPRKALPESTTKALREYWQMEGSTALVSIHPIYAEKIISGEKRLEFACDGQVRKSTLLLFMLHRR